MQSLPSVYRLALGFLALSFMTPMLSAEDGMAREKKPSKTALEKYDADKDGQLSDAEKAKAKEAAREKAKHTREANLAKYDTNKDGKLDDAEKAVKKADEEAARAAKKTAAKTAKETEAK
jgi:hypothetical protein